MIVVIAYNAAMVATVFLASAVVALSLGVRIGRGYKGKIDDEGNSQTLAVQGSLLGILALMLSFTFASALQRHHDRSEAVVLEANAIGTAWLRIDLLAEPAQSKARDLMERYVSLRVDGEGIPLSRKQLRTSAMEDANGVFTELWALGAKDVTDDPNPAKLSFVTALNDMTDAQSSRGASLERLVPTIIPVLFYCTFIMLGGIIGYGAGRAGHFPGPAVYATMVLLVVLIYVIIDLNRPHRGLIMVNQGSMIAVQNNILK